MPISRWILSPAPAIVLIVGFAIYQFIMRFTTLLPLLTSVLSLFAGAQTSHPSDDALKPLTIYAYGINATFIGYGATLTSLYVHDKNNVPRNFFMQIPSEKSLRLVRRCRGRLRRSGPVHQGHRDESHLLRSDRRVRHESITVLFD